MLTWAAILILLLTAMGYILARQRALALVGSDPAVLHSRPVYHGSYVAIRTALAGFALLIIGLVASNIAIGAALIAQVPDSLSAIERDLVISDGVALATGGLASRTDEARQAIADLYGTLTMMQVWGLALASVGLAAFVMWRGLNGVSVPLRARNLFERIVGILLMVCAAIAVLTTVGIVASLLGQTIVFFTDIPIWKFLFGTLWSPLSGVHEGTMDPDKVGAIPLFAGTLMITAIAMLVAVPVGLFSAIYLSDFASPRARAIIKPMLEILAGIPTVVYGFFAAITVAPFLRDTGAAIGLSVSSESALAAGVVMGIMIIPFISSLSDDVINAVPQSLRDGSYGLGATKAETIRNVVLPAALPGIMSAVLLGVSRAIGETMIVVMAAGQGANLTANPLEAVTTVTVQIVALITGDTEAATAAGPAFTLGFTLFCVTLVFNIWALALVRKYREVYD
jgi:phosphate transport system permease protein